MGNYTVVVPSTKSNKNRYSELVKRWWSWIYVDNCDDKNKFDDVTFLRGNVIGPRLLLGAGISSTPIDLESCHTKNITTKAHTNIFFPVYHVNVVDQHPYGDGKQCGSISRCAEAARNDLGDLYHKWAKIKIDGGQTHDITRNLNNHYFESDEFTLKVNGPNALNREEGFSLGKGSYQGVAFGTYILMNNFQRGTYEIDFGGKAMNYRTRAIYYMTVN